MKANKMGDVIESQLLRSVNVKTMKTSSGKVRKRRTTQTKRRKLRGTVVKMLAVMESKPESADPEKKPESTDPVMEFLVTGRTGRRNALHDILGPHAAVTSGDLPERLQSLSTADAGAGPSLSQEREGEEEGKNMSRHPSSQSSINEAKSEEKDVNAEDKGVSHINFLSSSDEESDEVKSEEKDD